MNNFKLFYASLWLLTVLAQPGIVRAQTAVLHHGMKISLLPDKHRLTVEDTIKLSQAVLQPTGGVVHFLLHRGLPPVSATPGVKIAAEQTTSPLDEDHQAAYYAVTLPPNIKTFVIKYEGEIYHPLSQQGEEYARHFSETAGIISADGIYLSNQSFWYPWFNDDLISFTLEVQLPEGWKVISQGERTRHAIGRSPATVRWESPEPQEGIYLVGGRLVEYGRTAGRVQVMAFLRTPDKKLASEYLDLTGRYLEMYRQLVGPYPYKKFALVENFWETGYGIPSFTLMGSRIIRLPFILYSSYPHEILHNWWGNGVYVDEEGGNWSEGLTTYLADHLMEEQRGTAAEYRRATLQKYRDYVDTSRDFPLTEFRSRSSSVTEAVGYGKTLMFFHMLRQRLGDQGFIRSLQKFYRANRFKRAGFSELQVAFSEGAGEDLDAEFSQWINRSGAPGLKIRRAAAEPDGKNYRLTAVLEQVQPGPVYKLRVPLAISLEGREKAYQTTVTMDQRRLELDLPMPGRPLRLDVDPEFDVFRRLDPSEVPPALTLAFGSDHVLVLLPSQAAEKAREGYRWLAESWRSSRLDQLEIKLDSEVDALPSDRTVWLLGWENRFRPQVAAGTAAYGVSFTDTGLEINGTPFLKDKHSVVLVAAHPANPHLALAWAATDRIPAMPGLGRKLPHYGKYSYLVFEGDEPRNIAKSQWPVVNSALSVVVVQQDGDGSRGPGGKLAPRHELIGLP
jgi:hypothetical protein